MKKLLAVLAVLAVVSVSSKTYAADGTVNLTNYDSNNPIMYQATPSSAVVNLPIAGSFVQVLGGATAGSLQVLSSSTGQSMFTLAEAGFFDGGFGVVPGVAENGTAQFQVRAWRDAATFDAAIEKGASATYAQPTGTNPPLPNLPSPAASVMPSFTVTGIPEPSTVILGLLGATVLLFRRRQ